MVLEHSDIFTSCTYLQDCRVQWSGDLKSPLVSLFYVQHFRDRPDRSTVMGLANQNQSHPFWKRCTKKGRNSAALAVGCWQLSNRRDKYDGDWGRCPVLVRLCIFFCNSELTLYTCQKTRLIQPKHKIKIKMHKWRLTSVKLSCENDQQRYQLLKFKSLLFSQSSLALPFSLLYHLGQPHLVWNHCSFF